MNDLEFLVEGEMFGKVRARGTGMWGGVAMEVRQKWIHPFLRAREVIYEKK